MGSVYRHPGSGRRINSVSTADILCATEDNYREFVVFLHDGVRLVDWNGIIIPDIPFGSDHDEEEHNMSLIAPVHLGHQNNPEHPENPEDPGLEEDPEQEEREDFEDQGQKAINYRNEPYRHRLENDPRIYKVFDSNIHGNPATPIFRAYANDKVVFRVIMAADKPRNHSFTLHGHV